MPPPPPRLPRPRSTATGDFGRTRSHPTGPPGVTTTAASCSACWARRGTRRRGWRTDQASPPPIPISISCRRSSAAWTASRMRLIPDRRRTIPTTPAAPCCPRAYPPHWRRSSANLCFAPNSGRCSSTISSSSSATRRAGLRNGSRKRVRVRATSRRPGSRTSISIFSKRMHYAAHANSGRVAAVNPRRIDAMLEKLNASRIEGADLYDWDELVQEDRVHRLIYTDPAIFTAEMTNIFGAVWVYLGHESQIPANDDYITVRLGLRPLILLRDSQGKIRALFNRCAHRGTTLCRKDKGSARIFTCPYHGWSYLNTGKLRAVPWPDGYACDFNDAKYNVAQVPRVDSYRGFIFATLNPDAPSLIDYLGAITKPIDEWLDRQPKGQVRVCEANRLKYKGNWKLAYDNSGDGYHVVFSHRSLLEMENRQADVANKGMSYYKGSPDTAPMYIAYMGNGHHFKDKRPNIQKRAGAWAPKRKKSSTLRPRSRSISTCFPTSRCSATISRCSSPSRSTRPTSLGTAPRWSTRTTRWVEPSTRSMRYACARRSSSRISAKSTTSPISRKSSAGSHAKRTSGSTCIAGSAFPVASRRTKTASSLRPPPTRCSCVNTSRNGSG